MRKIILTLGLIVSNLSFGQTYTGVQDPSQQENAIQRILSGNVKGGVVVGGYGEVTYGEPLGEELGEIDVQRMVLLFGYQFNEKTQFVTEIELEHVNEVFVEQALLSHAINDHLNVRAGLMLVPMGIINEYHEPTTFNGVFRPAVDKSIVPTTWREVGVGVNGNLQNVSLRYQAYIFNGLISNSDTNVAGTSYLGGENALRNGRQKGAKSVANNMNLSIKVDYYGMPGLRVGLSGYYGETSPETTEEASKTGSTVDLSMLGLDFRYRRNRFSSRGQYIYTGIGGAAAYNNLTGSDLGSSLQGWYLESAYNLMPLSKNQVLDAFVRYENYNTHHTVTNLAVNNSYDRSDWIAGISYHISPGAVVKLDYTFKDNAVVDDEGSQNLNMGIGVWF